jgi:DNA-binding SARP family transcriptional activator
MTSSSSTFTVAYAINPRAPFRPASDWGYRTHRSAAVVPAPAPAIRILGPIEVWGVDGQVPLGGPRQAALLACLTVNANRAVSTDQLSDWLWNGGRARTASRLQMAVLRLRHSLAAASGRRGPLVETVHGGYRLSVPPDAIDSGRLGELVSQGQRALQRDDAGRARALLNSALSLWRGPALADVNYHDFAQPEIRRLEELRITALEARFDADLQLGRHREIVAELSALLLEHPTREHLAAQLMRALYRGGRQADALAVYGRVRVHLARELGLEPGPQLAAIQRRILCHDLPPLGG